MEIRGVRHWNPNAFATLKPKSESQARRVDEPNPSPSLFEFLKAKPCQNNPDASTKPQNLAGWEQFGGLLEG